MKENRQRRATGLVTAKLIYDDQTLYRAQGTLRLDGGLLVFTGDKMSFAIGHDAFARRPNNLADPGTKLANAPQGTRLRILDAGELIRQWSKGPSEPTRTQVPLLLSYKSEEKEPITTKQYLAFSAGIVAAGIAIGLHIDLRFPGFAPRRWVVDLPIGLAGITAAIWLQMVVTKRTALAKRKRLLTEGFAIEPI